MKKNTRLRRLVVGDTTWHWTVRQRSRVAYDHCHLKLSLYPQGPGRRRLVLLFSPAEDRVVSNCYFDSGALVRLSNHTYLNLHEPGTVRRLLDAAAPKLDLHPSAQEVEVDGWPYFDAITEPEPSAPAGLSDHDSGADGTSS
ncbi:MULTISPECIES: hypothetical protein [Streptomyces]|uniref:Uncharacterized protein n=1 Tax=Streptomyces stelliscabiei TaxID=146820 RepID=A0A8I0TSF1_9ACTN|nr:MULTISPECIES: hypothetical protein [Streptomyces]MBE1597921.1 hypothetical protein [Streptomyces stelliscabiei]MDX2515418.1 hypothetical protein [Streptomyces stelliscabiei]MDX2552049.1 hypothetical protein [Streptomyces stelliscabiei]MDX2609583.1 hypothetical protein [Streptomyces stelliscabiei]MDX2636801.1 hypothetical protein [Streptomyces stelliscabiei]